MAFRFNFNSSAKVYNLSRAQLWYSTDYLTTNVWKFLIMLGKGLSYLTDYLATDVGKAPRDGATPQLVTGITYQNKYLWFKRFL